MMMTSFQLWESGSPSLVNIFTSAVCRLLFTAGDKALSVVVTMCMIACCSWKLALPSSIIMSPLSAVVSTGINMIYYSGSKLISIYVASYNTYIITTCSVQQYHEDDIPLTFIIKKINVLCECYHPFEQIASEHKMWYLAHLQYL